MKCSLLLLVFLFLFSQNVSFRLSIFPHSQPIKTISPQYQYQINYFESRVDHFSFAENATYKMRYLVNDTWQKGNDAPIFFYTGNEGFIEVFAENTGFMWDIAPKFGALLIFAEHRYYGESLPFGNKSFSDAKYLGYLTSEQALADYVDLIGFLKSQPGNKNSPVIVFGGSYGGMLSAWMRMKYPHIVQGAIAASAPILQFTGHTDCEAFARIVTSDFRAGNPTCPKLIRKAWSAIANITANAEGLKWLSETWKLCEPLKNLTQVVNLKNWLIDVYGNLAMVNYPYETKFLAPLPANPIFEVCKYLKDDNLSGKPLLLSLFKALSVYTNSTGETKCNRIDDASPQLGASGWNFQACTEMVMPMCSDGINDMFEPTPWNIKEYSDDCYKNFQVRPQSNMACNEYGCSHLSTATNIVFSNGLLDPWSSGGVLTNISSSTVAIIIPEGAHHLDLRGKNPKDPFSVIEARKVERYSIRIWIDEYRQKIHQSKTINKINV
ncbi:lysosomal Pro-X carboxypeptidase [Leptopilina heterotoma]|uniref:lysosomal Pro-X carboxypeptidase n=1 Tax=Leptopilina heterotoma TaxID=63436 RepID=UPI001CA7EF0A|nr:lysosomal Pro-X carboxypeptidase [Leptopilina heterotoma]